MDNHKDDPISASTLVSDQLPSLHTARLLIRPLQMGDQDDLFRYRSLPEVWQYQTWRPGDVSEAAAFIQKNTLCSQPAANSWLQLAICLPEGRLIGDLGIHFLADEAQVEIAYTLAPAWQGRGYAREAVQALIGFLFDQWQMHRIVASVDPDNARSIQLLQKIGFRQEAHFVKSFRLGDQWCDDLIYALLREEWIEK